MRVGILGCGYVGLELARQLDRDHDVIGVRRSADGLAAVEETGATAVEADVTVPASLESIPDVDALVFAASSGVVGRRPPSASTSTGSARSSRNSASATRRRID